MAKRKVLLLLHRLDLTGGPKIALDAFEDLIDEVDLQILSIRGGAWEDRCRHLGPLLILDQLPQGSAPWQRARRIVGKAAWSSACEKWQPDVIYVNSVAALPLAKNIRLPQAPVILHVHELESIIDQFAGSCLDLLSQWPQRYIAVSTPVATNLIQNHGVREDQISLIHEFVPDCNFDQSAPIVADAQMPNVRPFVVGGAGYPSWRKGPLLWLQMAFELVSLMGRDKVRFVWVGITDNEEGAIFQEMARKLGIEFLIDFLPVTREPLKHFAYFDIFAMTSWEDPCPIVVLEAMMLRKPVVCFAGSGGAPEEVADSGIVVENFSPLVMAQRIATLANNPKSLYEMGQKARERVKNHFLASVQTPKILAEIDKVGRR